LNRQESDESGSSDDSSMHCEENDWLEYDLTDEEEDLEFDDETQQDMRILHWKIYRNIASSSIDELMATLQFNSWKSIDHATKTLSSLVQIKSEKYDMCISGCMCYSGVHQSKNKCDHCGQPRFDRKGKARRIYTYEPLCPRVQLMMKDPAFRQKILYRHNFRSETNIMRDWFDGTRYQDMREEGWFKNRYDIAFLFTTDGFIIFRKKNKDCWVLALLNFNLGKYHTDYLTEMFIDFRR
jgi:hypothetical protein